MAFDGVPNETRKSLPDGTTIFERVLPGPDRMYPDTDSAPLPITDRMVEKARQNLPDDLHKQLTKVRDWGVPSSSFYYLTTRHLVPVVEKTAKDTGWSPKFVALLFAQTLKGLQRRGQAAADFDYEKVAGLCRLMHRRGVDPSMARELLATLVSDPSRSLESVVPTHEPTEQPSEEEILTEIRRLKQRFGSAASSNHPAARQRWIMGELKKKTDGQVSPRVLAALIEKEDSDGRRAKGL
jgi:glutamyl-tRNA(Gln) amidotransferase subunit E